MLAWVVELLKLNYSLRKKNMTQVGFEPTRPVTSWSLVYVERFYLLATDVTSQIHTRIYLSRSDHVVFIKPICKR